MATRAQPYVTGAVAIFPFVGRARTAAFLGYGREAPRIQIRYAWAPYFTDIGGPLVSFDEVFAGVEATVSVTLNFFRQDTLQAVESVPNASAVPGMNLFGDIGSLAIFEGLTYPLVLTYPYHTLKSVYSSQNPPKGVRFLAAKLEGPSLYTQGTLPREINLVWKCKSVYQPANGSLLLADNVLTGLPAAV